MQLNFMIVEKNGVFYKHRNGEPLEDATASEALMWAKISDLERRLLTAEEESESRYNDGLQDGMTKRREKTGLEITKTDGLIQDVLMIARKWHKDTYHKMVYSPEWETFKNHLSDVIRENVGLRAEVESKAETGWTEEHEVWRYRQIHPEVEKMGGWANYRFYMLQGRYRDAREFNDIKSKLSTSMTALERLWKYSINKRDRDMEIIVVDALESNGFNFNAERKT